MGRNCPEPDNAFRGQDSGGCDLCNESGPRPVVTLDMPNLETDYALMLRLRAGEEAALNELFRRHHGEVRAFCGRYLGDADAADDAAQSVFLRVQRYRKSFNTDVSFRGWLYRIARNVCVDAQQSAQRRREVEAEGAKSASAAIPNTEAMEALGGALARLAVDEREVILLARWGGLDAQELGAVLGCTPGAARVRLHRALARLRQIWHEMEGADNAMR